MGLLSTHNDIFYTPGEDSPLSLTNQLTEGGTLPAKNAPFFVHEKKRIINFKLKLRYINLIRNLK